MNIFLRIQCSKLLRIPKVSVRAFHKDYRVPAPQNFSDYESVKQNFKIEVPQYFNFAKDVLDHWAKMEKIGKRPSSPAFWWINDNGEEVKWNFQELGLLSKKLANVLNEFCGLKKGDRVIVILPTIPEWWLTNVACLRTGTVLIPGTIQMTENDLLYRLQTSKAKCIITNDTFARTVDSIAHKCPVLKYKLIVSEKPKEGWGNLREMMKHASADHICEKTRHDETMTIYFTSGTTGSPKMTAHTHSSYGLGLSINGRYWLDLTPSDIIWNTSDTGWAKSAWSSIFSPWSLGACVFVRYMPRFDPASILKTLSSFPITVFCSAPTAYRMLVLKWESSYKFKNLKHCVTAGEPINPEVSEQWKNKTGLDIYEGYGQTETVLICGTFKGMKIKSGCMGKPSPAFDVKDEPLRTASAFRGDFYVTGDRGYMDEDGYIWFIGRADDIILSSGYRIGPFEVESALVEHPAVLESAVVSSPDQIRGEVVKAFVVLKPDYKSCDPEKMKKELQEHVKRTTAPYKYPRKVEFVHELPKTISGKIKRNELRKKEWGKV
ncbi:acyl-coenzyme A synthetase ACSM3, mitochondrial isoform X2 [Dromiciops gliroides]|uniref:acyl-coenzyme A synthetase ACSM3, mitochondrial isoform X2 n=1 Tax=Dromiciops gliroides TaxID=33562 RepID=UPI001CC6D71A|nr:acyl-coenzyme A synthetase ACSM3, mitochondrial isoform X2 [Dromiciops gliroides]